MPSAEAAWYMVQDIWQRQFCCGPAIIGRVVTVGRQARTMVGVMGARLPVPGRNWRRAGGYMPVPDAPPREGPAVQVFGRPRRQSSAEQDGGAGL